jgi:predicted O-linked N-acetylglucosamine transferase (SPINDLY family)
MLGTGSVIEYVTNSSGQLTDYKSTNTNNPGHTTTVAFSGTHAEGGTSGDVGWGRWSNGTLTNTFVYSGGSSVNSITVGSYGGLHYFYGPPATSMPTSGSFTYNMLGATSPTFKSEGFAPGTVTSAQLNGTFTPTGGSIGMSMALTANAMNLTMTTSPTSFTGSTFNFSGNTLGGTCSSGCSTTVQGRFRHRREPRRCSYAITSRQHAGRRAQPSRSAAAAASAHGRIADLPRGQAGALAACDGRSPRRRQTVRTAASANASMLRRMRRRYRRALGDPRARIALRTWAAAACLDRLRTPAAQAALRPRFPSFRKPQPAVLALTATRARAACLRALAIDPDHGPALLTLCFALADAGELEAAATTLARARERAPASVADFMRRVQAHPGMGANLDPASIWLWRRFERLQRCDWNGLADFVNGLRAIAADPSSEPDRALGFAAMHTPLTAAERLQLARAIATPIERRVPTLAPLPVRAHDGPLRVGLLSPDIREHLGARLLLPLFELADRARIEWTAYALSRDDGSATRRLKAAVPRLREVADLRVTDTAAQVRRDRIDLLLDVGGYTTGAAFEITAARPAPVQVQYLGYPGTLGSRRVDYALADEHVVPAEHAPHWSEALVRLPVTHFLYDFREPPPAAARAPTRSARGRRAVRFHGPRSTRDFRCLEILRRVPRSLLWLIDSAPDAEVRLRAAAVAQGIDAGRLRFAPFEARERYLARYRLADLFIDALYHNGMTTVCDAMAAGLPVATAQGDTFTSRSAPGLVSAAGMPRAASPSMSCA